MNIWERVKAALEPFHLPMGADVFLVSTGQELPDRFLIYSLIIDLPEQHADNREVLRCERVRVLVFSMTGFANLPDIEGAMTTAGFVKGPAVELPYNPLTGHFGLSMEFAYYRECI